MRRMVELGFLLALALILSYVETLIPFSFGIPGIKLGLPNLIVMLLLYDQPKTGSDLAKQGSRAVNEQVRHRFFPNGAREALLVNALRIILSGVLFSDLYTIVYALSGAAFSFLAMLIGKKCGRFSMIGVSVLGGVFHNIGQIIVAMLVVETFAVAYYSPFLIVAGVLTGARLGYAGREIWPYLRRMGLEGE